MKIHEPPMIFASEKAAREWAEGLAKNQDSYGNTVYRFASSWARWMEASIEAGETVEQCADKSWRAADTEGITVFMYGCAVTMLSEWWVHGEQLRRWHNLDTQIGDEGERANESGGVLNPAILNIETKD